MSETTRRQFLQAAGATGASLVAVPAMAQSSGDANSRLRVALVGCGGRGLRHLWALSELAGENVEVAALCDVDQRRGERLAAELEKLGGARKPTCQDMRRLLDDDTIDAVSIATPDHWHALQTIWSCQAGKDVYCEKPGSHSIGEGRKMVEAARKYKRIVQHGTQCRSSAGIRDGIEKLQQGAIGRVYMARAIAYKLKAGGKNNFGPVPEQLDWDLWQGPAPQRPYNQLAINRWRFLREYGSGQTGDQGVHELDIVRWGLGIDAHPNAAQAMGAINLFHPSSDENTPTDLNFTCRYDDHDVLVTFETRDGFTNPEAGMGTKYPFVDHRNVVGVIFFGTEGYMIFPNYTDYYTFLGPDREPGPSNTVEGQPMMNKDHFANWIKAVRSRKPEALNAEIEQGHLSSTICHLANIAFYTGHTLTFDPATERFSDDPDANSLANPPHRAPYVLPDQL